MFRFIKGFKNKWSLWQAQRRRQLFLKRLRAQALYDKQNSLHPSE